MYAIVETGSKQYTLKTGDMFTIEKIQGSPGDEVVLSKVLMLHDKEPVWGNPYVEKAGVLCKILAQDRGPKITIHKFKRRKGYKRKTGHRQFLTLIKVEDIGLEGFTPKKAATASSSVSKTTRKKKTGVKKTAKKVATSKK